MVTSEDVSKGKPFPDPYLAGASKLGIDPKNCGRLVLFRGMYLNTLNFDRPRGGGRTLRTPERQGRRCEDLSGMYNP